MALLRPRFLRLATYSTVLALSIHFVTLLLLPPNSQVAGFIQVSIAAIALGTLIGIVLADYRRGGSLMRRIEEEVLVVAIFGLFWLSFATILRVFGKAPSSNPLGQMLSEEQRQHLEHLHHQAYHHHHHQVPVYQPAEDYKPEPPKQEERIVRQHTHVHMPPITIKAPKTAPAAKQTTNEPLKGTRSFVVDKGKKYKRTVVKQVQ